MKKKFSPLRGKKIKTAASGEVDITDLVTSFQATFDKYSSEILVAYIVTQPGFQWVATPVVSDILTAIISKAAEFLSGAAILQAFFLNTAIRKASDADDYVDAVNAINNLPEGVSDADYAKAEQAEIAAFNALVVMAN